MKSLFIDTSSFFVTIEILEDNKELFVFKDSIKNDMSSRILPIIRDGFSKINFELKDLESIFVVNGPGSFTGIRVGVSIAKTIAWGFNIKIIPISSLEYLATSNKTKVFCIPMIDARRGNVFAGIYDKNLDLVLEDQLISKEKLLENKDGKYYLVSNDFEEYNKPTTDVLEIINKHKNDNGVNAHNLNPRYLKLTEAEEKLIRNDKSSK